MKKETKILDREYDGCSDDAFSKDDVLIAAYPLCNDALNECKDFISRHHLTGDDVKIMKTNMGYKLIAKKELCITQLHTGGTDDT